MATAAAASGTLTLNAWNYVAISYDESAGPLLYFGNLTTIVAQPSYSAGPVVGSGATSSDAIGNLLIGARSFSQAAGSGFQGRIAFGGVWNRVLSLGEIKEQQFHPHVTSGCVLFSHLGYAGAVSTQPDWSGNGNAGTITGATQAAHVPLGLPFEY